MALDAPTPYQWAVSDVGSAALLNAQLYNGLTFLTAPPVAQLYQTTVQSFPNNSAAPVTFDSESFDPYAGHSTSTNTSRYVAQTPGWYFVIGTVTFASNATGIRTGQILKNGVVAPGSYSASSASNFNASATAFALVSLVVGDYVELSGNQSSGGSLSTVTNDSQMAIFYAHT